MLQTVPKAISIYLESNPNPNSLKFVVNEILVPEGMSFDFPDPESAGNAPLAQELFMYPLNMISQDRLYLEPFDFFLLGDGNEVAHVKYPVYKRVHKELLRQRGISSGCPSSTVTLKSGIENLFKRLMPEEVKGVEALD